MIRTTKVALVATPLLVASAAGAALLAPGANANTSTSAAVAPTIVETKELDARTLEYVPVEKVRITVRTSVVRFTYSDTTVKYRAENVISSFSRTSKTAAWKPATHSYSEAVTANACGAPWIPERLVGLTLVSGQSNSAGVSNPVSKRMTRDKYVAAECGDSYYPADPAGPGVWGTFDGLVTTSGHAYRVRGTSMSFD